LLLRGTFQPFNTPLQPGLDESPGLIGLRPLVVLALLVFAQRRRYEIGRRDPPGRPRLL